VEHRGVRTVDPDERKGKGAIERMMTSRLGDPRPRRDDARVCEGHHLGERTAFDVLRDDIRERTVLADLVNRADIRMVESRGGARFGERRRDVIALQCAGDHLDGHRPLQVRITGAIDGAHATGADAVLDQVAPQSLD